MGILDTLKNLTRPYDDDDDFYDDDTEMETEIRPLGQASAPASEKKSSFFSTGTPEYEPPAPRPSFTSRRERGTAGNDGSKVMNLNNSGNKVVFMKPERYETSKEICDHLQAKRIVLLNLDDTSKEIARRILDFMAGTTYALGGKITRISSSTYIVTPYSVDIVGGDLMGELENSGIFF